jgi:hypothetical protein
MPIETDCQGCGSRLRVADEFAGRKARCPHCKTVYTVPGTPGSAPMDRGLWRMQADDGAVYGPVPKEELDNWAAEGRITAGSLLRREGEHAWLPAAEVYRSLGTAATPRNPFGEQPTASAGTPAPRRAQAAPQTGVARRAYQPHRGGMVLTLGILGLLCCQLIAPIAWITGYTDLRSMDRGQMDPEGRSLTQVGMILGIVGTIILVLGTAFRFMADA